MRGFRLGVAGAASGRLTFAGVLAGTLALAASARGGEPWAITSTVECECIPNPGGGASAAGRSDQGTIGPGGGPPSETVHVRVTARNVLGAPLPGAGVSVRAIAVNGSVIRWDDGALPPGDTPESPQASVSDAAGRADFYFDEGGVRHPPVTTLPNLDFEVILDEPDPSSRPPYALAGCSPQLSVISYDLNASGAVDLVDFAIFATDLATEDDEANFNWNSGSIDDVDLIDFALFGAQLNSSLDRQ